jgi:HTH-type transcriptional regulator / antitoxin HigA
MTLTFNPEKYKELLSHYQPKLIRTESENEKALVIVEELMHRSQLSPEENELYELLIFLIEKFEQEFYSPNTSTPHSMLLFLMEQQNINKTDIENVFGSSEVVSKLVNGKQKIDREQAEILGTFFHVDPSVFI